MGNVRDQLNNQAPPVETAMENTPASSTWRRRIGIKAGLRIAFAAVTAVALAVSVLAFFALTRVGESIDRIVGDRLPAALETMHLGRQTDTLVATAGPLVAAVSETTRNQQRARIEFGVEELNQSLARLDKMGAGDAAARILPIIGQLSSNLRLLDMLVRERAALIDRKGAARRVLLLNLQAFQSQLAYRFRMLEGDAAVLRRQLSSGSGLGGGDAGDAGGRLIAMADLVPAAKLYADIEAINGRLLAAGEEPSAADVEVAQAAIRLKLTEIDRTYQRLEPTTAAAIAEPINVLRRSALDQEGLPSLRTREIAIINDSRHLLEENALIAQSVNRAVTALVSDSRAGVDSAAAKAAEVRAASLSALLTAMVAMLIGVAIMMHFYVDRHLIRRLSQLSEAMLNVAAGGYYTTLPPEGPDELGRLGRALRKFRDVAMNGERRENDLRIANFKANEALAALGAAQKDLLRQARTDFLTGIANRQHFMETAERTWERAQRNSDAVAVLMIDIDYFKHINDTYGHLIGDHVLQAFTAVCSDTLRPSDLLGRLGGEEFAVVLPGANLAGGLEAAERLRAAVAAMTIAADGMAVKITISIGVAVSLGAGDRLDAAIARADAGLYAAKQAGRNRIST